MMHHVRTALAAASLGLAALVPVGLSHAAGQDDGPSQSFMTMEYDGKTWILIEQLNGDELQELLAGNTAIFIHPTGEEQEFHRENGTTVNGWNNRENASTGFWQVEGDEVCWTYGSGTHCKPLYRTEREDLFGQVPGWYGQPLPFLIEAGDSRGMLDRPIEGDAI